VVHNFSKSINSNILISVVIPTFNAQERLSLLLKSLENQSNKNFEVIVVDDGSTDQTSNAVTQLIESYSVPLHYYYLDNTDIFGTGIARNHGAKHARGRILLFLDQDCVAKKNLIQKHIDHHNSKDIILGYYSGYSYDFSSHDFMELKNYVHNNRPVSTIKEFRDPLFLDDQSSDAWKCFISAHFSIKTDIFCKYYFDESFTQWGCEDIDLGYRIYKGGSGIHFVKECIVYNSSNEPIISKIKFRSLSESLSNLYQKHQAENIKLYCYERFYNTPLKYRSSLQLIFKNNKFDVISSQTKIIINKNRHSLIMLGPDLMDIYSTIEDITSLITSVHFDVGIIKKLRKSILTDFINIFHVLIKVLRDKKININLDDIRKQGFLIGTRIIGPKLLILDFYNLCNVQCLFCSIFTPLKNKKTKYTPPAIDLPLAQQILDQAYEMGVETIRISSEGEPLLSPEALPILQHIADKDFNLELLTNGTLLKKEHLVPLSKISRVSILVNFSAAKKSTYHSIYGGAADNYDLVLKSLSMLIRLQKTKFNKSFVINTTYIITKLNYHEISDYILIVKNLGVDHVYFKFALPHQEGSEILVSAEEIPQLKNELINAESQAVKRSLGTNINNLLRDIDNKRYKTTKDTLGLDPYQPSKHCYNGWFFGRINSSGDYYICCRGTVPVNNVKKVSFKNIYFSKRMNVILAEGAAGIDQKKKMWSKCNFCYHLKTNTDTRKWIDNK